MTVLSKKKSCSMFQWTFSNDRATREIPKYAGENKNISNVAGDDQQEDFPTKSSSGKKIVDEISWIDAIHVGNSNLNHPSVALVKIIKSIHLRRLSLVKYI